MINARRLITRYLPQVRLRIVDLYAVESFSQEGEDLILRRIFGDRKQGFYIDVGAHHPRRFSNTHFFYLQGWHGINIEPSPDAISRFRKERPRDVNLQTAISDTPAKLAYHVFDEPALNTFDATLARSRLEHTGYRLLQKIEVQVVRLDAVLDVNLPPSTTIDFMSIDVEGFDFKVVRSNDWSKYRPRCLLVEALESDLERAMSGELHQFMVKQNYTLFAKTYNTLFYMDKLTSGPNIR